MILPEPPIPTEVDLRDFQYMELDVRVLRDSRFAAQVSGDAFRAGVLLWCASWHQVPTGSLPDDDVELANLAGFGRFFREWRKVREEALIGFVKCSDGRLYHETVCQKALAAWNSKLQHHFDRARDRLRKLNKARAAESLPALPEFTFDAWKAERILRGIPMEKADASAGIPRKEPPEESGIPSENHLRGNGEGTERRGNGEGDSLCKPAEPPELPPSLPADDPPDPPPAAPSPAPAAAEAAVTPRGHRLADDWQLPSKWGEWALAEYPHWTAEIVRRVAKAFANHWTAKTGKDATKLDWKRTWENWCASDITQRAHPAPKAATDTAARNAAAKRLLGFSSASTTEVIDA